MKRGNKRYAIYRTKEDPAGLRIRGQAYRDIQNDKHNISTDHYRRIYMGEYQGNESLKELMIQIRILTKNTLAEPVGTSDVLLLNRDGEPVSYYIDRDGFKLITRFVRPSSGGTAIDDTTKGFQLDGKQGLWDTLDSMILDGRIYYLMGSQKYPDSAGKVIVDADGRLIADDINNGFDSSVKQKIREVVKTPPDLPSPERSSASISNGQANQTAPLRDHVEDGIVQKEDGSAPKEPAESVPDHSLSRVEPDKKQDKDNKPRKRTSVLKRLRKKQIEIAKKSGKPIPPYLQEAERNRK